MKQRHPFKSLKIFLISFLCFIASGLNAQNSWNLAIAFEDGTGARDTLRLYWDENATSEPDIEFGEEIVEPIDNGEFQVFFKSMNYSIPGGVYYENTAGPWTGSGIDGEIHAFNFIEPVTISYLSESFTNPQLFPFLDSINVRGEMYNDYFFFGPLSEFPCDCLDMADHDSILLDPNWTYDHFPIYFILIKGGGDPLGISPLEPSPVKVYPNPSQKGYLNLKQSDDVNFEHFEILDLKGQAVKKGKLEKFQTRIETDGISSGTYLLRLFLESGEAISKRLVIN